jgi:hypothetical protein
MAQPKTVEDLEPRARYFLQKIVNKLDIVVKDRRIMLDCHKPSIQYVAAELLEVYNMGYDDAIVEVK